jgi:hypothetical protein
MRTRPGVEALLLGVFLSRVALGQAAAQPYDEDSIPPGYYRAPSKVHDGLLLAGGMTGGTAYGLSLVAASYGTPELFVPVVGPWLAFHKMSSACRGSGESSDGLCVSDQGLDVADGVLQAAGAGLILAGLIVPKYKLLPQVADVQVTLLELGRGRYSVGAVGRF